MGRISKETEFNNKKNWMRDHHKGLMMGSVSAGAPFGTHDSSGQEVVKVKMTDKVGARVAPFGTDNNQYADVNRREIDGTANPHVARERGLFSTTTSKSLEIRLKELREKVAARGARGMLGLQRAFKIMDDDRSGALDRAEFTKALRE